MLVLFAEIPVFEAYTGILVFELYPLREYLPSSDRIQFLCSICRHQFRWGVAGQSRASLRDLPSEAPTSVPPAFKRWTSTFLFCHNENCFDHRWKLIPWSVDFDINKPERYLKYTCRLFPSSGPFFREHFYLFKQTWRDCRNSYSTMDYYSLSLWILWLWQQTNFNCDYRFPRTTCL